MNLKESDQAMEKMIIEGGHKLTGTIYINGAKNSAVALLPAAILSDEITVINNVPDITDISVLREIIELLNGTVCQKGNTIIIDSSAIVNKTIPKNLSNKLRASYYFMGALLAKYKHVEIYFPGGCNFGARQIDYHLKGFEMLGATIKQEDEKFIIDADELVGAEITIPFPSVGATINIMLAATKAKGTTTINNAAADPEIVNVAEFLINMGAKITGAGTKCIQIEGVSSLKGATIEVIPDRIEAGTYIIAGALMGDNLKIENINPNHLRSLLDTLHQMNINYTLSDRSIVISKPDYAVATTVKTEVYPGFPTDLAQPISVLLLKAHGDSVIEETIYQKRMGHVAYLNKMGANIKLHDNKEEIHGPVNLTGTDVEASDLRAGATLFLAALTTKEETTISNVEYILRGYEKIVKKLSNVGANIRIETIK